MRTTGGRPTQSSPTAPEPGDTFAPGWSRMLRRAGLVLLGILAALFALTVGITRFLDYQAAPAIVIDDPRPDATVVVAVEGAVATPGVYQLPGDARVNDAIGAAGGLRADADLALVNSAARIADGERFIIPSLTPTASAASAGTPSSDPRATIPGDTLLAPTSTASGLIDLNTATGAELDTLPGIGPARAAAIIAYRDDNGPFGTIDDLAAVTGISEAMVDELRALVTVGP